MGSIGDTQIQDCITTTKLNQTFEILKLSIQYLVIIKFQAETNMRLTVFVAIFIPKKTSLLVLMRYKILKVSYQNIRQIWDFFNMIR